MRANELDFEIDYFEGGGTDDDGGLTTPDPGASRRMHMRKYDSQYKLVLDTLSHQNAPRLKFEDMNDLDKYKQIQKRTKLLYGVSDVKRMINKSDASIHFY